MEQPLLDERTKRALLGGVLSALIVTLAGLAAVHSVTAPGRAVQRPAIQVQVQNPTGNAQVTRADVADGQAAGCNSAVVGPTC